jgi:hypothetical protein
VKTVTHRLAAYVAAQNPSRKIRTLEYGRKPRRPRYRLLLWLALAGAGVGALYFVCTFVVTQ